MWHSDESDESLDIPSLLDKLKCPTASDLIKIKTNPPFGKKRVVAMFLHQLELKHTF